MRFSKTVWFLILISTSVVRADGPFYVFAADAKNKRILTVAVTSTSGGVRANLLEPLKLPFGPTSIVSHRGGAGLIASTASPRGDNGPRVASIEVKESGDLRMASAAALAEPTGYTSVDRKGRFFLFANYRSGRVGSYRLDAKGNVGEQICSLKVPRAEAHCVLTTPDNRYLYVPCVKNNNSIYQYAFDEETGRISPLKPFIAVPPAMFGPRHVAYHPSLPIAYFSNEQQLGVSVYEIGLSGQLTDKQHATTIPRRSPFEQGKRDLHASDLVLTADSQQLFVAVRDFEGDEDSVFAFRIEEDGRLSLLHRTKVGDIPWKLDLSPNGKLLLVSESGENRLSILNIEPNGRLSSAVRVDWGAAVRDMTVVRHP